MTRRNPRYQSYVGDEYVVTLFHSVAAGMRHSVESMLDGGANPDSVHRGSTMLCQAAALGECAIAKLLIDFGADTNLPSPDDGLTPLMHAALETPDVLMLDLLLAGGARIDAVTADGMSALMLAAAHGNLDATRFLQGAGAALYLRTPAGQTAYDLAVANGNSECAAVLYDVMSRSHLLRDTTITPLNIRRHPPRR